MLPVLALAGIVSSALNLAAGFPLRVVAVYAAVGALILLFRPGSFPGSGMGPANRVTLGRIVVALPLAAFALQGGELSVPSRWWIVGLGTLALVLDGVDGWVARRSESGTEFGARFDMETDAALLLVLSVLAWRSGQVGMWALGIGALRYLFVALGFVVARLGEPLFPSLRRKVVCVIQGIALLVAVGPIVPGRLAAAIVGCALTALVVSFGRDGLWLLAGSGTGQSAVDSSAASAA